MRPSNFQQSGKQDSFVLLAHASLAASRTFLQRLVACLNFALDSEDLFCLLRKSMDWFLNDNGLRHERVN